MTNRTTDMDQNNVAHGATGAIFAAFEQHYAMDADDPASATELSHFINGWRAALASTPVAGEALQVAARAMQLIRRSALDVFDRQQHDKLIHDFAGLHERPAAVALASEASVPGGGQAAGDVANSRSTGSGHGPE